MAVLAINIGATHTRIAVVEDGTILEQGRVSTEPDNYSLSLAKIQRKARTLRSARSYDAIGICAAGNVKNGVILGAGNLPDWVGKNLKHDMQCFSRLPVVILNDCQAEGLGAFAHYGRALTFVGLGTGLGVSFVRKDGVSTATECGHDIIALNSSRQCGCGGFGHAEAYLGGQKLTQQYGVEHAGLLTNRQWDEEVLPVLAAFLRNLSNGEDEVSRFIAIGGGMGEKQFAQTGANRLPLLVKMISELTSTTTVPEIEVAPDVDNLGLYGAAYAAGQLTT